MTVNQMALPGIKMPELEKLEDRVRKGLASFVETGRALQQIEEKRGYILRGYKDFAAYCEGEFHFSLRQGQRLMIAAETAQKVEKAIGESPRNEATARVLTQVASEPKLLEKVKKELEKKKLSVATATAEKLQEVVDRIKPQTRALFAGDKPKPAPITAAATLTDQCPKCAATPDTYTHKGDGWKCGACYAPVMLGVSPLSAERCPDCNAILTANATYCGKCGSVV